MNAVYRVLAREPVLLGALALAIYNAALPHVGAAWQAVAVAAVAWGQRLFSSPKKAVEDAHDAGYNAAVADVSSLIKPPPIKP